MSGTRLELDGDVHEKDGQQFMSGRGRFSDGYTKILRIEPHGFMSNPVKGAKALLISPNGNPDEAYILGGEHPGHRPAGLPGGTSAIYDAAGNIIKLVGTGIVADVAGDSFTIKVGGVQMVISAGGVEITGGSVTHNGKNIGDTHVHGGIEPGSSNTDVPA
jgi:phage gp45-like